MPKSDNSLRSTRNAEVCKYAMYVCGVFRVSQRVVKGVPDEFLGESHRGKVSRGLITLGLPKAWAINRKWSLRLLIVPECRRPTRVLQEDDIYVKPIKIITQPP